MVAELDFLDLFGVGHLGLVDCFAGLRVVEQDLARGELHQEVIALTSH